MDASANNIYYRSSHCFYDRFISQYTTYQLFFNIHGWLTHHHQFEEEGVGMLLFNVTKFDVIGPAYLSQDWVKLIHQCIS